MKYSLIFIVITAISLITGLAPGVLQPILHTSIPIVIISLGIASLVTPSPLWPWLGLASGLALDLTTLNPFGTMSIYFLLSMQTVYLIGRGWQLNRGWWWSKVLLVALVAFIYQWYLLLINGQFEAVSWQVAASSMLSALITTVVVGLPAWFVSRRAVS